MRSPLTTACRNAGPLCVGPPEGRQRRILQTARILGVAIRPTATGPFDHETDLSRRARACARLRPKADRVATRKMSHGLRTFPLRYTLPPLSWLPAPRPS